VPDHQHEHEKNNLKHNYLHKDQEEKCLKEKLCKLKNLLKKLDPIIDNFQSSIANA
jgi:hypothetical protein